MIHYYFGGGKGKTSAAVGACIRAAGAGMKCAVVQFFKNGTSSEISLLRRIGIDVFFCRFQGVNFFSKMSLQEREAVISTHNENLLTILSADYQFIVLDEFGDVPIKKAAKPELVEKVLTLPHTEIIITGHSQSELIASHADYITEFNCIAHPFQKGICARKGIEF